MSTEPEVIDVPVWVKRGSMLQRRDCLDADNPDNTYHYIRRELGLRPEDYGVSLPQGVCPRCGYDETNDVPSGVRV